MPSKPNFDLTLKPEGENAVGLTLLLDEEGAAQYSRRPISLLPPAAPAGALGPEAVPPEFETSYVIEGAELGPGQRKWRDGARRVGKAIGVDTHESDILIPGPKVRYVSDINMLTDGGFEVWSSGDLSNWTSNNVSDLQTTSSPTPEEGAYCAKITGTGASPSLSQTIGTHFAQCYAKITIRVYVPTGQSTPTIRLTDGSTDVDVQPTTNDAWETVTVEYDYSAVTTIAALQVHLIPGSTSDHFFVDEAKCFIDRFVGPAPKPAFGELADEFYLASARTIWKYDTFFKAQDVQPGTVTSMVLFNDQLCSAMGGSQEWEKSTDGSTWAANGLAGDNRYADSFAVTMSRIGNPVLWKALSPNKLAASTNPNADLGWVNYTIGDSDSAITGLTVEDNILYIQKEDGVWRLSPNGVAYNLTPGWRQTRSVDAGEGAVGWDGFVYVPAQRGALWRFDTRDNTRRTVQPGITGGDTAEYSGKITSNIGYGHHLYSFLIDQQDDPAVYSHVMKGHPMDNGVFRWAHLAKLDAGRVESCWVTELTAGVPRLFWASKDEESATVGLATASAVSGTQANTDASSGRAWADESNVTSADDVYATWPDETATESEESPGTSAVTDYSEADTWADGDNAFASDDSYATSDLDAQTAGPSKPSANSQVGGSYTWSSLANLYADDGSYASTQVYSWGQTSNGGIGRGFGFSVPTDALIVGVKAEIEAYSSGADDMKFKYVYLDDNGTNLGTAKSSGAVAGSATVYTFGGATALWSASLTPAIVNDANFGIKMYAGKASSSIPDGFDTLLVDYIDVTIYYTSVDTDGLKLSNFGFSLPSDAAVVGIEVDIEKKADVADTVKDKLVQLLNASGTLEGDDKADVDTAWGTSDATANYGGSTDMWGTTFAKADVEDSDFGVEIRATKGTSTSDVIASIDHVSITIHYTASETGDYLDLTNFGFAIPTGATINGVTVSIERSQSGSNSSVQDVTVQMIDAGSAAGDNLAKVGVPWPASDATQDYGGATTSWGVSWTVAKINASNFGVRLQVQGDVGVDTALIDLVTVTVHYSTAAGSELDNKVGWITLPSTENPRHDSNYEWATDVTVETGILNRFPGWQTSWHEIVLETSEDTDEKLGSDGRVVNVRYDALDGNGWQQLADGDNVFNASPLDRLYFRSATTQSVVTEKINIEFEIETTDVTKKAVIDKITIKGTVRPNVVELIECAVMIGPNQAAIKGNSRVKAETALAIVRKLLDPDLGPAQFWDRDKTEHQVMVDIPGGGFVEHDIQHYADRGGTPKPVKGISLRLFIVPNSSGWDKIT